MASDVLVDASAWIAMARHEVRGRDVGAALMGRTAVASSLTWAELRSAQGRGRLRPEHLEAVAAAARIEPVADEDCHSGGRLHGQLRAAGHAKVSLVDCIVYASARRLGVGLVTLDQDLAGLPGVERLGKA